MVLPVNATSGLLTDIRADPTHPGMTSVTWGDGTGYFFNFRGASSRTTNVMTVHDGGRVGIVCNAPQYVLDINGSIGANSQMLFTGSGGGYGHIRLRGSENIIFFHDFNVTATTGWLVGQTPTTFGAGVGTGFGIARTTNTVVATNSGLYMTSNSRVGINCNAPNYDLNVNGNFAITSNTGGQFIVLRTRNFTVGGGSPAENISEIEMGSTYGPWIRATKVAGAYADYVNLGFWTNVNNNNATPVERMTILAGGPNVGTRVGIGITFPNYTLDVSGNVGAASGFSTYSDERIKANIQDVQDDQALQQLRLIQPKTYTYKDVATRGTETVYGFIAQQIRSVLPYSTDLIKNAIPDIYEDGDRVDDVVTLRNSTFSFSESSGKVKFIQKKGGDLIVPVNFISSNQLQILDTSNIDLTESEIFVYGREVDDFHALKKDAIFTVNVAATQELDRQLQAAKVQIASLETRLALLESQE